jgi:hypothetical protein
MKSRSLTAEGVKFWFGGGQFFPQLTPGRLAGATLVGSFCKMRGIYPGFRMEINANGHWTVTTPVNSIGVLA